MLDNSYSHKVLRSECSSMWGCNWPLKVYLILWNLKTVCKSSHKHKSLILISNFFQLEIELYFERRLCTHFDKASEVEANKKVKIIVFQMICFSKEYGISDNLFIHLWTLSTNFFLMQVKKRLLYIHFQLHQLFTMSKVNQYPKSFCFQRLMLWKHLKIIF